MTTHSLRVLFLVAMCSACGPHISQSRNLILPARPEGCSLAHINTSIMDLAPGGRYEMIGSVALSANGDQDPLKPEFLAEVDKRACAMGGDTVTVMQAGSGSRATKVLYAVLRDKGEQNQAGAPDAAPQTQVGTSL